MFLSPSSICVLECLLIPLALCFPLHFYGYAYPQSSAYPQSYPISVVPQFVVHCQWKTNTIAAPPSWICTSLLVLEPLFSNYLSS